VRLTIQANHPNSRLEPSESHKGIRGNSRIPKRRERRRGRRRGCGVASVGEVEKEGGESGTRESGESNIAGILWSETTFSPRTIYLPNNVTGKAKVGGKALDPVKTQPPSLRSKNSLFTPIAPSTVTLRIVVLGRTASHQTAIEQRKSARAAPDRGTPRVRTEKERKAHPYGKGKLKNVLSLRSNTRLRPQRRFPNPIPRSRGVFTA